MFSRLGVLNAFLTYDTFSLWWVYWDITPLKVKEDVYMLSIRDSFEIQRYKQVKSERTGKRYSVQIVTKIEYGDYANIRKNRF